MSKFSFYNFHKEWKREVQQKFEALFGLSAFSFFLIFITSLLFVFSGLREYSYIEKTSALLIFSVFVLIQHFHFVQRTFDSKNVPHNWFKKSEIFSLFQYMLIFLFASVSSFVSLYGLWYLYTGLFKLELSSFQFIMSAGALIIAFIAINLGAVFVITKYYFIIVKMNQQNRFVSLWEIDHDLKGKNKKVFFVACYLAMIVFVLYIVVNSLTILGGLIGSFLSSFFLLIIISLCFCLPVNILYKMLIPFDHEDISGE